MNYLHIFANCRLVKGASMSLICDLQLRKYYQIPNDMLEVLEYLADHSLEECVEAYGHENKSTIQTYINFILKHDMGFMDTHIMEELIPLSLTWDAFSEITNIILEISPDSDFEVPFMEELLALNLSAVEIRSYEKIPFEKLKAVLAKFKYSTVISIKLVLHWDSYCQEKNLKALMESDLRINTMIIHSAPQDKHIKLLRDTAHIFFGKKPLDSCLQCGIIQPSYFSSSIELFSESQLYNTCLNRKLSVDKDGYIKNCPSMASSYGHINSSKLQDILENPAFKQPWAINKDRIEVCKDCEFRYVCTDCRAYTERTHINAEGQDFSKPLKCGYDPYANQWADWSTNPLKQQAISYYQMESLIASQ